jgi:hypothetical protein
MQPFRVAFRVALAEKGHQGEQAIGNHLPQDASVGVAEKMVACWEMHKPSSASPPHSGLNVLFERLDGTLNTRCSSSRCRVDALGPMKQCS